MPVSKSPLLLLCAALSALALAACGPIESGNADGALSRDGSASGDAAFARDVGNTSDVGSSSDVGNSADVGNTSDVGGSTDVGLSADVGSPKDAGPTTPMVLSTTPAAGAIAVSVAALVNATFSEPMNATTLDTTTFTLSTAGVPVLGSVTYANPTATFRPTAALPPLALVSAKVTTGAKSAAGVALATDHAWSFTTRAVTASELPVDLGSAGNFVILAKSGISTVPTSAITGNLGLSPAAASFITGFSLIADSTNVFATCPQVTGKVYAANYAPPTPSNLTTAVGDMLLAFTDAAGRAPDFTELGAGDVGGMTLAPGVYKWGTGLLIPSNVTLTGSATDVWIFQIAQNLTLSSGVKVHLAGAALPKNIFWQVAGAVDLGTTAHLEGVVLCQTAIALHTGASVNGRLLAQTAVTLDGSTVVAPAP